MTQRRRHRNRAPALAPITPVTEAVGFDAASASAPVQWETDAGSDSAVPAVAGLRIPASLSVESSLYLLFIVAAVVTRFWDLGKRALHHDESLHAYYSWVLAQGNGYHHDPLMHGPFLFEANALVYLLFGDSDATSRYLPALTGVLIVASPWLLRAPDLLGRVGALTASFLLLISPSFFYYTRYIRHDPYTALGSIVLFACIVRYRQRPERRWLIGGAITLAVLFANHEIVFALVAIFGGVVWGSLLWGRLRPLLPVHVAAGGLLVAVVVLLRRTVDEPLPTIPWKDPTPAMERQYYVDLLSHPLSIAVLLVLVAFVGSCVWIVRDEGRRADDSTDAGLFDDAPVGSTEAAVRAARGDLTGVAVAVAIFVGLSATMFTTFFTNLYGLASGTIATDGTLLYWLGQQGEQRGDQPWFFYLLLAPQYEFLAVVLGIVGLAVAVLHAARGARAGRAGKAAPARLFVRLFLATWFVLILAGLSYAGEKMPWLLMHIALPAILLGSMVVDDGVNRWRVLRRPPTARFGWPMPRRIGRTVVVGLCVCAGAWLFLAGWLTYGEFDTVDEGSGIVRVTTDHGLDRWWLLAVPPVVAAGLLLLSIAWRGVRMTGRDAFIALVATLALLQIHASWRLSYLEGDTPVDMLMYNQTAPDVTRMMSELGELSNELYGGKGLVIWYDAGTAWPIQWYLRDFPGRVFMNSPLEGTPQRDDVQADVLLVANDNLDAVGSYLSDYTAQEYVLRWHFPESIYRQFAIAPELDPGLSAWTDESAPHGPTAIVGSVWDSLGTLTTPDGQGELYRLVMYRDLPVPISGFDYTVFVRNDLVPLLNTIRY